MRATFNEANSEIFDIDADPQLAKKSFANGTV
jgi:hypothetical protein